MFTYSVRNRKKSMLSSCSLCTFTFLLLCVCVVGRWSVVPPLLILSLSLSLSPAPHQEPTHIMDHGIRWRGVRILVWEGTLLPRGSGSTSVMEGTPCKHCKRWLKQANRQRCYWALTQTLTLCQLLTLTLTLCQLQNKDEEEHIHCGCAPTNRVGDRDQRRMASKCRLRGLVMTNVLQRWLKHAKHCLLKFKGSKSAARGIALCRMQHFDQNKEDFGKLTQTSLVTYFCIPYPDVKKRIIKIFIIDLR